MVQNTKIILFKNQEPVYSCMNSEQGNDYFLLDGSLRNSCHFGENCI